MSTEPRIGTLDDPPTPRPISDPEFAGAVLDAIELLVVVLDHTGAIIAFNRACETLTGYSAEEACGRSVWEFLIAPEEIEGVKSVFADLLTSRVANRHVNDWVTRTGEHRRISWSNLVVSDDDGNLRYVVGTGLDITQAAEDRATSLERGALLHSIINTSPDAIVIMDERGVIRDFSAAGTRIFGYDPGDVIGKNVSVLMPEPYRAEHDAYIARYCETGEMRIIGELRELTARRKDGSVFPVEVMVDEVVFDDERLFTGFLRDISFRKQAESELRRLHAELMHAARIAILGETASAIAHEVNQPLTAIANYVAALRRLLENPEADRAMLRDIAGKAEDQVKRARDIIVHVRTFLRKGEPVRQTADFNGIVEGSLALGLVGAHEMNIETETSLARDLPSVSVDPVQIQQVILNLVRNAVDALAGVERRRLVIETRWREPARAIEFAIRDSGPGLAPEVSERLFHPFVTTKAQGTGIGLSLCRSIIEAHEGRIWAEPGGDGGVTFRFTLPAEQHRITTQDDNPR